MRALTKEETKAATIKRAGKHLMLRLAAVNVSVVEKFNKLGQEYNCLYNKYLTVPAIHANDHKLLASLALFNAMNSKLKLALPEYPEDGKSQYLGNLPILSCSFSGPEEQRKLLTVQGIGQFRIIGSDAGDTLQTLAFIEKLISKHNRRNPHFKASGGYTLDAVTTTELILASTESLMFPEKHKGADFVLHLSY